MERKHLISARREREDMGWVATHTHTHTLHTRTLTHILQDTRELVVHQLQVKVAGWSSIRIPISVDKIGVFFREIWPENDLSLDSTQLPLPPKEPVKLVFAISLSDTQKVVNVRSALVLVNTMGLPLEVRVEQTKKQTIQTTPLPLLPANGYAAIPLHLTSHDIRVRPYKKGVEFCSRHLAWKHAQGQQPTSHTRECEGCESVFRFCVSVQREHYPPDSAPNSPQPAHTITLYPPLTIVNLLPCDLQFSLTVSSGWNLVKRGKEMAVYSVSNFKVFL